MSKRPKLEIRPLQRERWKDLCTLFGKGGAYGGCWCMWWRSTRAEFERRKGAGNRGALQRLVRRGDTPGLLAYADGEPVGWCSLGPREDFPVLGRSPVLKPVDDLPTWSIVCFYVHRRWRRQGVGRTLLDGAVRFARQHGAARIEGYPVVPRRSSMPDYLAYVGTPSLFEHARFREVLRRSPGRPIMRRELRRSGRTTR